MITLSECRFDHLTAKDRETLTMLEHRALQLADWIERDRNEWLANGFRRA